MVGSFQFLNTLPDLPASAVTSPAALGSFLQPFTSHTGPRAFTILAWIYVAVHFGFLSLVIFIVSMLVRAKRFWLFRTVNGRHGLVLIHNVVDVPLCLIGVFFSYDAIFWIISLLGYENDIAQHNWQVLHWLRYILLATTGFYFMTGVAAVWPFSPSTMRYPLLWNLVMVGFLPTAIIATIPPMLQANYEWNTAWEIYKSVRTELQQSPADQPVSGDIMLLAQQFLFHTSKYAYKHAIVAIILVIFCSIAALVFSVIGVRVAGIVWQDVKTRRMRSRREVRMARRWSRPSINLSDSTTSKGFASIASVDWTSQGGHENPQLPAGRSEDHAEKISPTRCDSALPLRMNARQRASAQQPVPENLQRELRMHFYRTLVLFASMWCMIASLVGSGLYFAIRTYPATRDATPDALFGNSALRVLCIFHIVEFANITFFGQIWIGTLVLHRIVALKKQLDRPPSPLFKERATIRAVAEQQARPIPGYTFALGRQPVHTQQKTADGSVQHRVPTSPTTPTFSTVMTPYTLSPPLTPMLDSKSPTLSPTLST
ncbi:unnamed protein product [Tilletia controversa]|uniref:Uncharacterized protein n=3 Tax=Tilletia TaxID=13289 RepID=A0A8X7MW84_9BASI|nr:hypothetical protein CF336_g2801 [Tilletia laevis]KAE8202838.1 hypothetical protein CF328_g1989 [Tilletia controversa]KAE8262622.1 hypothetical protein A4X03_0g2314 [Tilletia caries]KAE8207875.1 hypothetical protein CF335_g827 [Tilletia laevis]KAE8251794.1 hypothetical protein A4X06_0g2528 [Tilletia controversa]